MGIFRSININLYKMYFKNELNFKSQYEYLKYMYLWNPEAVKKFEEGRFNPYNTSYRWMQNGIPDIFFVSDDSENNIFNSPHLFDICYDNLKNSIYLTNNQQLLQVIDTIISDSERAYEPFVWEENVQKKMQQIYETYDCIHVLCTLLIYAQTNIIYTQRGEYQFKNDFSYVKVYKKEIINHSFDQLLKNAVEVNMSQISVPSLIESYHDFFKKKNRDSIINALAENPDFHLNMLMIDPDMLNVELLMHSYMYGDSFSDSRKVINDSICFAAELMERFPNQVVSKIVSVPMSYSFMQIKKKDEPSVMKIDIYTPYNNADERFSMIFNNLENKELYDYYSKIFYRMFYDGTLISEKQKRKTYEYQY